MKGRKYSGRQRSPDRAQAKGRELVPAQSGTQPMRNGTAAWGSIRGQVKVGSPRPKTAPTIKDSMHEEL